jgi:hypothetical protein
VRHSPLFVIPAKAGIHWFLALAKWIPAFAGMTLSTNAGTVSGGANTQITRVSIGRWMVLVNHGCWMVLVNHRRGHALAQLGRAE